MIAHFYSICGVLKIDLTLPSNLYHNLKSIIQSFRENDYSLLKKRPSKTNSNVSNKTWNTSAFSTCKCTIAEIQKEELSKRQSLSFSVCCRRCTWHRQELLWIDIRVIIELKCYNREYWHVISTTSTCQIMSNTTNYWRKGRG